MLSLDWSYIGPHGGSSHSIFYQNNLEMALSHQVRATGNVEVNMHHECISFDQHDDGVTVTVRDRQSDTERTVRAKYLVAADGANSFVRQSLGITTTKGMDGPYQLVVDTVQKRPLSFEFDNGQSADPERPGCLFPLVDEAGRRKVTELVEDAVAQGARVATGGRPLDGPGWFYAPTVLDEVPATARILREEVFGPVAPVTRFTTEEEAITLANATEFGLAAYVFTRDVSRALRVCEALEAGMVGLNQGVVSNPATIRWHQGQRLRPRGRTRGHRRVPRDSVPSAPRLEYGELGRGCQSTLGGVQDRLPGRCPR